MLKSQTRHASGYINSVFRLWRKRKPAFDFLPEDLKARDWNAADQETTNSRKRSRSVSIASSQTSTKRERLDVDWTEREVGHFYDSDNSGRESMFPA